MAGMQQVEQVRPVRFGIKCDRRGAPVYLRTTTRAPSLKAARRPSHHEADRWQSLDTYALTASAAEAARPAVRMLHQHYFETK